MEIIKVNTPKPDANLAAGKIAAQIPEASNLGIGTTPGSKYKPIPPETLNSAKAFLTDFLGLENKNISITPAKGGGTGAINLGLAVIRTMGFRPENLSFGKDDWSGYESIARAGGFGVDFLSEESYSNDNPASLVMVQTTRNGSGKKLSQNDANMILEQSHQHSRPIFIDLPYFSGSETEKEILRFFQKNAKIPVIIAWSPTKIFQTFEDRPGGATIVLYPSEQNAEDYKWVPTTAARGTTGFDDAVTRDLWNQMNDSSEGLRGKHQRFLDFINNATGLWKEKAPAKFQHFFDESYGGMFRIFPAKPDTQKRLAEEQGIVAVQISDDKIRVNICGILTPDTEPVENASDKIEQLFNIIS